MALFDIGVNLAHRQFESDREAVLERALAAGVTRMAVTGVNLEGSRAAAQLAAEKPGVLFATAGIHPHYAAQWTPQTPTLLTQLLSQPGVVAVGECGLDFNRNFSTKESQTNAFQAQINLAAELQKPLFLHERDAAATMIPMIKSTRAQIPRAVVHCFTADRNTLQAYLDLDLHIGITGWICDERRGLELRDLVKEIPLNRLMLETDAPFLLPRNLTPKPESKRNEPRHLVQVLKMVALCLGLPEAEVAAQTTRTALEFFGIQAAEHG